MVEGYTDVLALHQAGVTEAVAIMGTAITPDQLTMLSGLTDSVVLALDADRAGADAMIRAQRVAGGRGMDLQVAAMPEDTDPADMLAAGEMERFTELVEAAIDLPSFRVRTALGRGRRRHSDRARSGAGRSGAGAEGDGGGRGPRRTGPGGGGPARHRSEPGQRAGAVGEHRRSSTPAEPGEGTSASAARTDGAQSASGPTNGGGSGPPEPVALTPRETRERALLSMCIADPKTGRSSSSGSAPEHMSASGAPALAWLRDHLEDPLSGLPRDDEALISLVTELKMASERDPVSEGAMQLNFDLLEQQRLEDGISAAQEAGDYEASTRLSRERAELTNRIAHADTLGA